MRSKLHAVSVGGRRCCRLPPAARRSTRASARRCSYDMAVQTIDPDPVYPEGSPSPATTAKRPQKATERYRKGTTKAAAHGSSGVGSGQRLRMLDA